VTQDSIVWLPFCTILAEFWKGIYGIAFQSFHPSSFAHIHCEHHYDIKTFNQYSRPFRTGITQI
jgi:hypothetical protein